nr:hypothetical protein [Tanacetum cinerariifolium]
MAKLAFCDYHNMISILEKAQHNINFHPIVDFIEASYIWYALTINPSLYVSHIQQFWSTTRIETTNKETKILATVDGKPRTISESSLRRHLKLNDADRISSLHDTELFENLSLMGYNILPNQRFTFQKGKFSHQWKFLIHTIMQCLSIKSTCFNEFSSNIATVVVCLATNKVYNFSKMIFDGMVRNVNSKGSNFLMYPSLQRQQTQIAAKIKDKDLELSGLKARVKILEDKERGRVEPAQEDASIKGGTVSVSPIAAATTFGVPTIIGLFPTASAIFTTASVVKPYSRRSRGISAKDKGKEKVVESEIPKKRKLQEQINA